MSCIGHFVEECYRVLKKGGQVITITDNANYIEYIFNKTHHLRYKGYGGEDIHYGLYTSEHLISHFKRLNFKILKADYICEDLLYWRRKGQHKYFSALVFEYLAKINNVFFKHFFNKRVYIVALK